MFIKTIQLKNDQIYQYDLKIPAIENYGLLALYRTPGMEIEIIQNNKVISKQPDPFFLTTAPKELLYPIQSEFNKKTKVRVTTTGYGEVSYVTFFFDEKGEIKNRDDIHFWCDYIKGQETNIDNLATIKIYEKTTERKEYLWGYSMLGTGQAWYKLYVNKELMSDFGTDVTGTLTKLSKVIYNKELKIGDIITVDAITTQGGGGAEGYGFVWLTDKPYIGMDLPWSINKLTQNITQTPKNILILPEITAIKKIPQTAKINVIQPYPTYPRTEILKLPEEPHMINLNETNRYKSHNKIQNSIPIAKEEQRTAEMILSPFGLVRKEADTMGSMRTSNAAINYKAGDLNTTDTNAHTVWTGYGSKAINLYAKTGNYKIRILTLYNWLAGNTIEQENYIDIDEGQTFNLNIDAKELEITAKDAAAAEIYWNITI